MGFTDSIRTVLSQKYATFSGRASRSEYWWFQLFIVLVYLVIAALFFATTDLEQLQQGSDFGGATIVVFVIAGIFVLGMIIPLIALVVRRLHDRDMSGWWYLAALVAGFIPFVGFLASIALLVITILKGTDGPNRFGPDPLALHGGSDVFA
jgi:uncharacterized membrane protein YhaH (DUF805 family)